MKVGQLPAPFVAMEAFRLNEHYRVHSFTHRSTPPLRILCARPQRPFPHRSRRIPGTRPQQGWNLFQLLSVSESRSAFDQERTETIPVPESRFPWLAKSLLP